MDESPKSSTTTRPSTATTRPSSATTRPSSASTRPNSASTRPSSANASGKGSGVYSGCTNSTPDRIRPDDMALDILLDDDEGAQSPDDMPKASSQRPAASSQQGSQQSAAASQQSAAGSQQAAAELHGQPGGSRGASVSAAIKELPPPKFGELPLAAVLRRHGNEPTWNEYFAGRIGEVQKLYESRFAEEVLDTKEPQRRQRPKIPTRPPLPHSIARARDPPNPNKMIRMCEARARREKLSADAWEMKKAAKEQLKNAKTQNSTRNSQVDQRSSERRLSWPVPRYLPEEAKEKITKTQDSRPSAAVSPRPVSSTTVYSDYAPSVARKVSIIKYDPSMAVPRESDNMPRVVKYDPSAALLGKAMTLVKGEAAMARYVLASSPNDHVDIASKFVKSETASEAGQNHANEAPEPIPNSIALNTSRLSTSIRSLKECKDVSDSLSTFRDKCRKSLNLEKKRRDAEDERLLEYAQQFHKSESVRRASQLQSTGDEGLNF